MSEVSNRALTEGERRFLKIQTGQLIEQCGGVECAAAMSRVSAAMMSNYQRPETPHFMPLDIVLDLSRQANWHGLFEAMATVLGMKVSETSDTDGGGFLNRLRRVEQEHHEAIQECMAAAADGVIDKAEAQRCAKELHELSTVAKDMAATIVSDDAYRDTVTSGGARLRAVGK